MNGSAPRGPPRHPGVPGAVWGVAGLFLVLHLLPRPGYGFHRDELLYLAMADHLELLGMQFPPLIALAGRAAQALPLDLLASVRVLAAVAGTLVVLAAAETARRMGGGPLGQLLAAAGLAASPLVLRTGALFQPVVFEILWWSLAALAFTALLGGGSRRWWLVMGLAAGLGGLTKFSAAFFGASIAVGVLASPLRRDLRTRWPWLAVLAGGAVALPSVLGQIRWGWPFFAQAEALRASQLDIVTPGAFLVGQLLVAGAAAPLLVLGAAALFLAPSLKPFRGVGVAAATALLLLLALHGKEYYFGPMHPVLVAAGGAAAGPWLAARRRARLAAAGWGLGAGLALLPMGIPLLPPPAMAAYAGRLGITRAVTTNRGTVLPLPQDYADMLGWRELVAEVARVHQALDPAERADAAVIGGNYGRAGALAVYHRDFGLPYPISRHGDFYNWGTGDGEPQVVIVVGGTVEELRTLFDDVVEAGRTSNPMGVEEERDVPVHVCRRPREPLRSLWARLGPVWG